MKNERDNFSAQTPKWIFSGNQRSRSSNVVRNFSVRRRSNYGDRNFCVHRASTIDLQKNVHRASTIEHPKFTVHRASNIRSSLCIGHRPPVIAFPRNQRNKKRLKQTSSFVKVKAPTTNATKTKHIFFWKQPAYILFRQKMSLKKSFFRHVIYSFCRRKIINQIFFFGERESTILFVFHHVIYSFFGER